MLNVHVNELGRSASVSFQVIGYGSKITIESVVARDSLPAPTVVQKKGLVVASVKKLY